MIIENACIELTYRSFREPLVILVAQAEARVVKLPEEVPQADVHHGGKTHTDCCMIFKKRLKFKRRSACTMIISELGVGEHLNMNTCYRVTPYTW